jgi:hypothetical protein
MAYISQTEKQAIAPVIKKLLVKYGVKGTLSITDNSTLKLTIRSGKIDFIKDYNNTCSKNYSGSFSFRENNGHMDINQYHFERHFSEANTIKFLKEAFSALKGEGWYDKSDMMTDYFNVKHYVDITIGRWDSPYILVD